MCLLESFQEFMFMFFLFLVWAHIKSSICDFLLNP
jgi:hypothetical protein